MGGVSVVVFFWLYEAHSCFASRLSKAAFTRSKTAIIIDYCSDGVRVMRGNESLIIGGLIVLAVLLTLNLLYAFRSELKRVAHYLSVMCLAGAGAFSIFSSFGYNWRMEQPGLMALGVSLALGAWYTHKELMLRRDQSSRSEAKG